MVIAVTHYNDEVFPHFGRSPEIALYLVDEDTGMATKRIAEVQGGGHEGIALLLNDMGVDYLLCGGIGQGAISVLHSIGIQVFPGCSGNVDDVVRKFLSGELEMVDGPTCNCHDHEDGHSCGCHHEEEHSCGCHEHDEHCSYHEEHCECEDGCSCHDGECDCGDECKCEEHGCSCHNK